MTRTPKLYVPAITPFKADLSIDTERFIANSKALLDDGADGLAPFGTTSEANSMSVAERIELLDALIDSGIAADRLIPGTGCAALTDSIALTRHAVSRGCLGTLSLPPFYYKGVPEQGIVDSFSAIIDAVAEEKLRIYLYHIPQMTGVPVTLTLIEALMAKFPGIFVGLKDSSGNWENTHSVIKAFPELDVYSASEALIPQNVAAGGAGCISASANVNARNIKALMAALGTEKEAAIAAGVTEVRKIFEGLPLIPAIKAAAAARHKDQSYAIVRPPFVKLADSHQAAIDRAVQLAETEV
ncbi:MAG: dihydrodipicolinate synthase family protein [Devosia sp.]|jgi:4-hydroxy-tetrahydrodipicolinate synthase|uniref:dihydrodipicolinate synthase family protein n=1 Tax=unclassified Devosia TaxID=196773 RepID=UPI0019E05A75|nr:MULTISPECIES: dihydrodipicolinate synthase family protein [unclassified Devosia]MBF0678639.1 dihydrodipicolinate synthase family protein [Devosia sp.]WEJ31790.1 dihydrodipicolinate synthase family protein [Devosia sp. SD17-2]